MALESKHINGLRSASRWLRSRSKTYKAVELGWGPMMDNYADSFDELIVELESLNLPKTVVNLDDLFAGNKK